MKTILAIETSCDETAVSLVQAEMKRGEPRFKVLIHTVASQTATHAPFGGVVPMLARREHEHNLPLLAAKVIAKLPQPKPDLVAATIGPGLEPALWTGLNFARLLAAAWRVPLYPTNHLAGHLYSPLIALTPRATVSPFDFPVLALIASGGHTELVLMRDWGRYRALGSTRDDAVGESYDKVARLLELPYPGGPALAELAAEARRELGPNERLEPPFPRPMLHSGDFDFSFSGLKTAVLYKTRELGPLSPLMKKKIALAFEDAALDVLLGKTSAAAAAHRPRTLVVGGGVAANRELVRRLRQLALSATGRPLAAPRSGLTGDNASMIAAAAFIEWQAGKRQPIRPGHRATSRLRPSGRLPLS